MSNSTAVTMSAAVSWRDELHYWRARLDGWWVLRRVRRG
jgi:hypothetical protein